MPDPVDPIVITPNPTADVSPAPTVTPIPTPAATSTTAVAPSADLTAESILGQLKKLPALELDTLVETLEQMSVNRGVPTPDPDDDADDDQDDEGDEDVSVEPTSVSRRNVPPLDRQRQVRVEDLDPAARRALATVHNQLMVRSIKETIDSDPDLGYNLKGLTAKGREAFDKLVKREIGAVLDAAGEGFDYDWDRTAKTAVAAAKGFLAPMLERRPSVLGVPGAPGNIDSRTLEEPKRVPELAGRDDRDSYLADRVRYNLEKLLREQTTRVE